MSDKALKNQNQGAIELFLKIKPQSAVGTEISLVQISAKQRRVNKGQSCPRIQTQSIETVSEWLPGHLRAKSSGFQAIQCAAGQQKVAHNSQIKRLCAAATAPKRVPLRF